MSFGGQGWRQFGAFLTNVDFIGTTDGGEFGVQKAIRIYFYGKFNVWMMTV